MRNPHVPRIKYRVFMFNTITMEKLMICAAGRDPMTKGEADRLIKQTGLTMAPWVYVKEVW